MVRVVVGLTGYPGSGKGEVAKFLSQLGMQQGLKVLRYSLSDEVRQELALRGKKETRTELINLGNELREKLGKGVLAQRVVAKVVQSEESATVETLITIDAIRNPGEVEVFRQQWGQEFHLVAVVANEQIRKKRLMVRARAGEQGLSDEEDRADREIGIDECIGLADWTIRNESSLNELQDTVQTLWDQHLLPLLL